MMLSKSNGLSLETHSKCVAKIADSIALQILGENIFKEHVYKIRIAALIHDIGKCTNSFQNYIKSKIEQEDVEDFEDSNIILHHELSWAIAFCLFNKADFEYALNAIYWHHAKPIYDSEFKTNDYISSILNTISTEELENIYKELSVLIKDDLIPFEKFIENVNKNKISAEKTPEYYIQLSDAPSNRFNIIYRSCLIASDRISSSLTISENLRVLNDENFLHSLLKNEKEILAPVIPSFYNKERVSLQVDIAKQCHLNSTTVVKAPAGFGKTLIGLLWSLERSQKLLWVCPRNIVVESVYDSILSEIKAVGLEHQISVELFITGVRKKCTNSSTPEFQSDIVITNIDNFLAPISRNRFGKWSIEILQRDVVFDEYHEFIGDNALFGGFIEIMKLRHSLIKCNTVLLSATPSIYHSFWDSLTKRTKVLPNTENHYPAAHENFYEINFIKENELIAEKNSVIITNSIFNAQTIKKNLNSEMLIHSAFIDEDREEIFNRLFDSYKKNNVCQDKPSVSSAPIIQASCDISFKILSKSICSPESDIQVVGRCCRWGEYLDSKINFFTIEKETKSELKAISSVYDIDLHNLWSCFLKKEVELLNFKITLNDLYKIYNKFNIVHELQIKNFIKMKLKQSMVSLSKIEPIKTPPYNSGKKIKSATPIATTSLRSNGESVFVTYRRYDDREDFVEPFSVSIPKGMTPYDYFEEGKDERFNAKLNKTIKTFIQTGKFRHSKRFKNNVNPQLLFRYAYRKDAPYVAFNKEYSKEFGLAKISIYNSNN
jgi:CRISPR-associated endonuclease Cas3-HD